MKKKSFKIPFKSNFFKEQDPFHLVIVFFIIFFGTAIFFSVPTFYDYEKYNQQIKNTINEEFNIKISDLEEISFKFIPSPHLLIKKTNLKIRENEKNYISELKNVKVFISIFDLYKNKKFVIKKMKVKKANIYLNDLSFKNIIYNLKKNSVNNLEIKNSTIFYKDTSEEVILISKIKNLDYKIDFINRKKIFNIRGNIFDADFDFKYLLDYEFPNIQNIKLEFTKPNLIFENKLIENKNSDSNKKNGNLQISFLNHKNIINYQIEKRKLIFTKKDKKNSNFELDGYIDFEPFHFDLILDLKKLNLNNLETLLYSVSLNEKLKYDNLSGKLKINLIDFENKLIKNAFLDILFENNKLNLTHSNFNLDDFAKLKISEVEYLEQNNQILQLKIMIEIDDFKKFNKFLFNFKKDKIKSKNVYFIYQFDNSTGNSFISKLSNKGYINDGQLYKFSNLKQLKNLIRDDRMFIED